MTAAFVQTSAQGIEPDMFADQLDELPRFSGSVCELRAVLASPAYVQMKAFARSACLYPVLCMAVRPARPGAQRTLLTEQVFSEHGRQAADARAAALKPGTPITLLTSVGCMERSCRTSTPLSVQLPEDHQ
jgi:hypothetical protein